MRILFLFIFSISLLSCDWAKQKAKNAANKTGEVVAKTGSEFADGVKKGVEKTFQTQAILSEDLKSKGLQTGKILISETDSATDNVLTIYLIFDEDIDQNITAKVLDENGQEYGRATVLVKGQKGEAKYVDFVFDNRTNIDSKGTVKID